MKLASILLDGIRHAAIVDHETLVPVRELNDEWHTNFPEDLDALLQGQALAPLQQKYERAAPRVHSPIHLSNADWAPLLARPRNLWGVGLNFRQHAKDLDHTKNLPVPSGFHRPTSCLAGHHSTLRIPTSWGVITGEAEIGALLGKPIWNASRDQARDAVAGYTALLDLTAEELLRKDTRYIGRSKAFPDSVALGPILITPDEWEPQPTTLITTRYDNEPRRQGRVEEMTWDPWTLLADFSHVFPWHPGDVLQTGTPGAVPLQPGGTLAADVEGLPRLECTIQAR